MHLFQFLHQMDVDKVVSLELPYLCCILEQKTVLFLHPSDVESETNAYFPKI